MSLAESLNIGFTLAAMNPKHQPGRVSRPAPDTLKITIPEMTLRSVTLEHQHGLYRVFRLADGHLLHSHECKVEAVRRGERDGYAFTLNN